MDTTCTAMHKLRGKRGIMLGKKNKIRRSPQSPVSFVKENNSNNVTAQWPDQTKWLEENKGKWKPETGEITKENNSKPHDLHDSTTAKKEHEADVVNQRKIETGQRRAERVKQAITRDPQLTQ